MTWIQDTETAVPTKYEEIPEGVSLEAVKAADAFELFGIKCIVHRTNDCWWVKFENKLEDNGDIAKFKLLSKILEAFNASMNVTMDNPLRLGICPKAKCYILTASKGDCAMAESSDYGMMALQAVSSFVRMSHAIHMAAPEFSK